MTSGTRIGILGGTFDPVHLGHVETALAAARALALDRVLLLPSGLPPHRRAPIASRFHRFAMTALAVTGVAPLAVSDVEIGEPGPSYSYDTLARLQASGIDASRLFFITGADAFAEIATWSRYPDVLDMAHFVVISRPRCGVAELPRLLPTLASRMTTPVAITDEGRQHRIMLVDARTPDVSSTEIRRRLETGSAIGGLVPDLVARYIDQHGLYSRVGAMNRAADHLHG
jgi:nicotinate-nucleotide adenylyltransferase